MGTAEDPGSPTPPSGHDPALDPASQYDDPALRYSFREYPSPGPAGPPGAGGFPGAGWPPRGRRRWPVIAATLGLMLGALLIVIYLTSR